jgi:hypothetical protein
MESLLDKSKIYLLKVKNLYKNDKDKNRTRTDFFCIVCNSIFVILLFIISIAVYNNCTSLNNLDTLIKMSLPNDLAGNICGFENANNFTILYYPDINDPVT